MQDFLNINCVFNTESGGTIIPLVTSFHSYPMKLGRMGNRITQTRWALEYHFKNAGGIFLKTLSSKQMERKKNTVHLYTPETVYWEDTSTADFPIQETYLFFRGADICGLDKLINPDIKFARFFDPDLLVAELFQKSMNDCSLYGENAFWMLQGRFAQIIFHLLQSRKISETDYILSSDILSRNLLFRDEVEQYLRKNLNRNIRISDIASYMKTSESMLCHRFKSETGISPIARLIALRIEFAQNLLLKGEKLKSIAEMTGFGDEYHLSKTFKSVTGMPPSQYRLRNKQ